MKSRIVVTDPSGAEIGQIVQQNAIGKIRFGLESGGHTYGMIQGENWRAWNFRIDDHTGTDANSSSRADARVAKSATGWTRYWGSVGWLDMTQFQHQPLTVSASDLRF